MIAIFTDYGHRGPYLGQVKLRLHEYAPEARVITLLADAPSHNPRAAAYLLAAFTRQLPGNTVVFAVVDPGVGSDRDRAVIIQTGDRWFVGPDNGLFDIICNRSDSLNAWEISWRPDNLSRTFHGRDLYAPVCAMLEQGDDPPGVELQWSDRHSWPNSLYEIIYIDRFGNVMTGIEAADVPAGSVLELAGHEIIHASTFSDVKPGATFWYGNSSGLVEVAVNQGSAAARLGVTTAHSVAVK